MINVRQIVCSWWLGIDGIIICKKHQKFIRMLIRCCMRWFLAISHTHVWSISIFGTKLTALEWFYIAFSEMPHILIMFRSIFFVFVLCALSRFVFIYILPRRNQGKEKTFRWVNQLHSPTSLFYSLSKSPIFRMSIPFHLPFIHLIEILVFVFKWRINFWLISFQIKNRTLQKKIWASYGLVHWTFVSRRQRKRSAIFWVWARTTTTDNTAAAAAATAVDMERPIAGYMREIVYPQHTISMINCTRVGAQPITFHHR